jgi:protein SCO1/2
MKRIWFLILVGLIVAIAGSLLINQQMTEKKESIQPATPKLTTATLLQPAKPLIPFSLTDSKNSPFTQTNLLGQWSLLFFGYAECPEICPRTLAIVSGLWPALLKQIKPNNLPVRFVFVSLDPKTDTPQNLSTFLGHFNIQFIGLTGEENDIKNLSKVCNVYSWQETTPNAKGQKVIDHTASLLLINPRGQIQAIFSPPHEPQNILKDLAVLMNE